MNAYKRSSSPLPLPLGGQPAYPDTSANANHLMSSWGMTAHHMPAVSLGLDTSLANFPTTTFDGYGVGFQTSPQEFMAPQQSGFIEETEIDHTVGLDQSSLNVNLSNLPTSMPMDSSFISFQNELASMPNVQQMPINWSEVDTSLFTYAPQTTGMHDMSHQQSFAVGSPSEAYLSDASHLEVRSLPSSCSDAGWGVVDHVSQAIFNPEQTLHPRTFSDSSLSDHEQQPHNSWEGYLEITNALNSPSSESGPDGSVYSDQGFFSNVQKPSPPPVLTTTIAKPIAIRRTGSGSKAKSPTSPTSRGSRVSKTPIAKSTGSNKSTTSRRAGANGKEEKRVGRRKGPLSTEQRKQASEIRKLGACIRCRFLKKTCDKGDPCAGCQPSHARLWLVPCTRVDIKDLGYFLKGWKADYERHVSLAVSVTNVKSFGTQEIPLLITHGYGHFIPITAREVHVRDESVFGIDWVETHTGKQEDRSIDTARLAVGPDGVNTAALSEYLERHIDGGFEYFVDEYFQGTPFVTEILKIAYRFYTKEKTPVIRKALKLVLAYNLTQSICLVQGVGTEDPIEGRINDENSDYNGQIVAPMMINFQVKTAMAEAWRELQKSLLEDLSQLYSSIYSRDKLKHWPTIFMLASVLLVVWEEMQFDCRYRVPDEKVVEKFCHDMESTPVGVIVGLFSAISQKVPSFTEWDTQKHHALLGSNRAVCEAMEDVREGVKKHEKYLRERTQAKFDRTDFDSLSNTFVSKLVIRAH